MSAESVENLKEKLSNLGYEGVVVYDNPDYAEAFLGVSTDNRAVYDYEKMVQCLVRDGMNEDSAVEWIDYNCVGMHREGFPIIVHTIT